MDLKTLDLQIHNVKVKLKEWEFEFYAKNRRKPNKNDISEASQELQDTYKNYFKLKQLKERGVSGDKADESQQHASHPSSNSNVWSSDLNKKPSDEHSKASSSKSLPAMATFSSKLLANATEIRRKKSVEKRPISVSKPSKVSLSDDNYEGCPELREDDDDLQFFTKFPMNCKIKISTSDRIDAARDKTVNIISAGVLSFPKDHTPNSSMDWCESTDDSVSLRSSETFEIDCFNQVLRHGNQLSAIKTPDIPVAQDCRKINSLARIKVLHKSPANVKDVFAFDDEALVDKDVDVAKDSKEGFQLRRSNRSFDVKIVKDCKYNAIELTNENQGHDAPSPKRLSRSSETKVAKVCKVSAADVPDEPWGDEVPAPRSKRRRCTAPHSRSSKAGPTENYVRINLKKKIYCRGKKKFNYRNYKFKHWQRLQQQKQTIRAETNGEPKYDFATVTEEEKDNYSTDKIDKRTVTSSKIGKKVEKSAMDNLANKSEDPMHSDCTYSSVEPIFNLMDNNVPKYIVDAVHSNLKKFGHEDFREGQFEGITRILAGLSTLVIQPTGSGKSLCYLLPALMYARRYACMTLVISPLVSLMEDQVARVPACLKAACYHTNMTATQREKVKTSIINNKIDVLFMSPEGIVSGAGAFGCLPPGSPPIAFVCIDEVHCVSSWSHNFRPTYLRLCRIIRERLKVNCVLGLTATATTVTIENICDHLGLQGSESESVVRGTILPSNLRLTVSKDDAREQALIDLLQSEPYTSCDSIIIYCIRREQTDRLAVLIRTCLQQTDQSWTAEAYHAGLSAAQRRRVQNQFMSGSLRVIIATVAFGMGLNKPDVRAVIHYNMPKGVESYVQEIGRAGRDGKPSYCHLFLDSKGEDRRELRRHIYGNTVDRSTVSKLLKFIFKKCKCGKLQVTDVSQDSAEATKLSKLTNCSGHEVAFPVDEAVDQLDVKEEGIETLLCYLELHSDTPVQLLHRIYGICRLFCYGGSSELKDLAEKVPAISIAASLNEKDNKSKSKSNELEFNIVQVANLLGVESYVLRKQLRSLQWSTYTVNGETKYKKSGVVVDFRQVSFHVRTTAHLDDEAMDRFTDYLHNRVLLQEKLELRQLQFFHSVLSGMSFPDHWACEPEESQIKSDKLKSIIQSYFKTGYHEGVPDVPEDDEDIVCGADREHVIATIRRFVLIHGTDSSFTGRSIARIFHGIPSPRYPAEVWGRVRQFWRSHLDFDFNTLCKLATEEILRTRRL